MMHMPDGLSTLLIIFYLKFFEGEFQLFFYYFSPIRHPIQKLPFHSFSIIESSCSLSKCGFSLVGSIIELLYIIYVCCPTYIYSADVE